MKYRSATFVFLASVVMNASASAFSPAIMSVEECVQKSDYIFVAVETSAHYVDPYGRVLTPKQALKMYSYAGMEHRLRVVEVLYPRGLRPSGVAKMRLLLGPKMPPLVDPKRDTVKRLTQELARRKKDNAERRIYLTRVVKPVGQEAYVVGPGMNAPWAVPLWQKARVLSLIRQKQARTS